MIKKNNKKKIEITQAVILCGGLGSRLGQITKYTPKPLIRINRKPFLDYILDRLFKFGIKKVILLCAYKSQKFFKKYHKIKYKNKMKILCIKEKTPLGTGGAIIKSKKKLENFFFLINGDTYFNFNLLFLKKNFLIKNFDLIISTKKQLNKRYGELKIRNNIVYKFTKPKKIKKTFINLGVYICKKKIFNNFYKNKFLSLENDILPKLAKEKKIQALNFDNSFFIDIGIKRDLIIAKQKLPKIHKLYSTCK